MRMSKSVSNRFNNRVSTLWLFMMDDDNDDDDDDDQAQ